MSPFRSSSGFAIGVRGVLIARSLKVGYSTMLKQKCRGVGHRLGLVSANGRQPCYHRCLKVCGFPLVVGNGLTLPLVHEDRKWSSHAGFGEAARCGEPRSVAVCRQMRTRSASVQIHSQAFGPQGASQESSDPEAFEAERIEDQLDFRGGERRFTTCRAAFGRPPFGYP